MMRVSACSRAALLGALLMAMPAVAAAPDLRSEVAGLEALQQADQRVANIGWRLVSRSLPLCQARSSGTGLTLHDLSQYEPLVRPAALQAFGLHPALPSVLAVAEHSPAARAGIRPNDILLAIGERSLAVNGSETAAPAARYASVDQAMQLLEALPSDASIQLILLRQNREIVLSLVPETVCHSRIELAPGAKLNANANGSVAQISGALAEWTKNDDELAVVIGHEIAHNQLGHQDRITAEQLTQGLRRSYSSRGRRLRDMEHAADRLGTQMASAAGFNYRLAPRFWERLTWRSGLGAIWATTHPSAANRRRKLEDVLAEIASNPANPRR